MKVKSIIFAILGIGFLFNSSLYAQDNKEIVLEKMKTFSWMVGDWNGEAWYIGADRAKHYIDQNDDVSVRLGGAIFIMEGTGSLRDKDSQGSETVFNAFGILTYNVDTEKFTLRAYKDGNYIDSEMQDNRDGSFTWFIDMPYGKTRYTLHLTDEGHWNEKGEFSHDGGQTWMHNFNMTLKRAVN